MDLSPEFTVSAATWEEQTLFEKSKNRGKLGSQTLLTSEIKLLNGEDSITVQCLWDSGSESSFFSIQVSYPLPCNRESKVSDLKL